MSDKEILEKAIDRGWRGDLLNIQIEEQVDGIARVYWDDSEWSVLDLIFNHEFAKALWGDNRRCEISSSPVDGSPNYVMAWQYHLQQMVDADDRIKYLGDNMESGDER